MVIRLPNELWTNNIRITILFKLREAYWTTYGKQG